MGPARESEGSHAGKTLGAPSAAPFFHDAMFVEVVKGGDEPSELSDAAMPAAQAWWGTVAPADDWW